MSRTQKLKGLSAASLRLKTLNDNPYVIEILMSRMQKLKGLSAASLILKTLNGNPYFINPYILNNYGVFSRSYCDCCLAKS